MRNHVSEHGVARSNPHGSQSPPQVGSLSEYSPTLISRMTGCTFEQRLAGRPEAAMLIGLVAADVRPDRRYWWRATLLGRFHRSVACALRAVYVQSGHRQQPGVRRGSSGCVSTNGRSVGSAGFPETRTKTCDRQWRLVRTTGRPRRSDIPELRRFCGTRDLGFSWSERCGRAGLDPLEYLFPKFRAILAP